MTITTMFLHTPEGPENHIKFIHLPMCWLTSNILHIS